ncbi:unnamed protein product, partial [marine sediment metagenome]
YISKKYNFYRKMENKTKEKIGYVLILNILIII